MHLWKYLIVFIPFLTNSCSFLDNESISPAFLDISIPTLQTKIDEGAPVHNIKHAWLILDGQLLGVFPIPSRVPIIPTGKKMTIQINAGVNENGNKNSSVEYPFFAPYKTELEVKNNETYKIDLKIAYKDDAVFDFIEGFENGFHLLTKDQDGNTDTRISLTSKEAGFGQKSGEIVLNQILNSAEFTTEIYYDNINNKRGKVYLEFDYKTESPIFVGTDITTASSNIESYKVAFVKSATWKRAYVDFTDEISMPSTKLYRILFKIDYDIEAGVDSETYLDNVKLLHF